MINNFYNLKHVNQYLIIYFLLVSMYLFYRFILYQFLPESIVYGDGLIHSDGIYYHGQALKKIDEGEHLKWSYFE